METLEIETGVGVVESFSLDATEVVMRFKNRPGLERRVPYWNISPNYIRSQPKGGQEIVKICCFLFLFVLFAIPGMSVWILWVPAVFFLIPIYFLRKQLRNRRFEELTFLEDSDGGWAMTIRFKAEEESRVLAFIARLLERIAADRRRN